MNNQDIDSAPTDSFVNDEGFYDGAKNPYENGQDSEREIGVKTTERNPLAMSENENQQNPTTGLNQFVTKVPQQDTCDNDS